VAATPKFKVFNALGQYVAACKWLEDAAMLVGFYGVGATIRWGHRIVIWREGEEATAAYESYDTVAEVCLERIEMRLKEKESR
jgi:hypothetical protein